MGRRDKGARFNLPLVGANPSSPVEGDMWYRTDTHSVRLRNNNNNVEFVQKLKAFNVAQVSITTVKTTICSLQIDVGTWHVLCGGAVLNNSATAFTQELDYDGTATGTYNACSMTGAALSTLVNATGLAATPQFSVTSSGTSYFMQWDLLLVVTAVGTLTWAGTKTTSGTATAQVGTYMSAERWA